MPDVSKAQQRLMQGIAHGMKPRSKNAPSPAVAKKFVAADKAKGKGYVSSLPDRKTPPKPVRFA